MFVTEDTTRAKPETLRRSTAPRSRAARGASVSPTRSVTRRPTACARSCASCAKRSSRRRELDGAHRLARAPRPRPRARELHGRDRGRRRSRARHGARHRRARRQRGDGSCSSSISACSARTSTTCASSPSTPRSPRARSACAIPASYPVFGEDAFRTATGVHAAAIAKAHKKGDAWLADRIYSGVPAGDFGLVAAHRRVARVGTLERAIVARGARPRRERRAALPLHPRRGEEGEPHAARRRARRAHRRASQAGGHGVSAPLSAVMGGYLDLRWRLNPVEATYHGVDRVRRHVRARTIAESVREQLAALVSYENAIEEAEAETLAEEIDRTAVLHSLRHDLLLLGKERKFAHDPSFHLMHAVNGIFLLLTRGGANTSERSAQSVLLADCKRCRRFSRRRPRCSPSPTPSSSAWATSMIPGAIALIQDGLDDPALDLAMLDELELEHARTTRRSSRSRRSAMRSTEMRGRARESLRDRPRALRPQAAHGAHDRGECGRAAALRRAPASGAHGGRADRGGDRAGCAVAQIAAQLRTDIPSPGSALDEYREAMDAARHFAAELGLVPVVRRRCA